MKNSVNQYSVEPVSFECIDEKRFRFFQIDHMIHLKRQFSKNFFFEKSWSGEERVRVGGPVCGWDRPFGLQPSTINEQTQFLLNGLFFF